MAAGIGRKGKNRQQEAYSAYTLQLWTSECTLQYTDTKNSQIVTGQFSCLER